MARTISEIKDGMTADFMNNENIAERYGFNVGDNFSDHFSRVSVENMLFYIFAASAWVLESLFDIYKTEIEATMEEIIPHRPKWYRDKMLAFMKGCELVPDTDKYDTSDMTEEQIEAAQVVRHAVAVENSDSSLLTIKVRGEEGKLDEETEVQLAAYIAEIKDAGVRISLVNEDPDVFNCTVDVYYNPLLLPETVGAACVEAIEAYIANLPFNGEYNNMTLVDKLQAVDGVRIVGQPNAGYVPVNTGISIPIALRAVPVAGYFAPGEIIVNPKPYEQV